MSAATWTPTELQSESRDREIAGWRAVEAQNQVATMHLVQNVDDQLILEQILDEWKPPVPPKAQGLHWLLSTPFRYPPPPSGSRFRGPHDEGVFYGAFDQKTCCAEMGYWRLRFALDSKGLRESELLVQGTLFQFHARGLQIHLGYPPFSEHRALWTHPTDYGPPQALAAKARSAGLEMLAYESVRNPGGECIAILSPSAFRNLQEPYRNVQEGWSLLIEPTRALVAWQRGLSRAGETLVFSFPELLA